MGRCAAGCILKMSSYLIYLDHQNAGGNRDMINILPSAFDDGLKIRMVILWKYSRLKAMLLLQELWRNLRFYFIS